MSEDRSKEIILEFRKNFTDEKRTIQDRIVETEAQIRSCNEFITSLSKKDDCDFNVFSPRSATRVYKDQVDEKRLEIESLENEVKELYKKLSSVTKKIDSLDELDPNEITASRDEALVISTSGKAKLLKLQEDDRQRIAVDLHDTVLQNLSLIMHNLELTGRFIDYDPIRAKLELESNRKLVKETVDEIRSTIFDLRPMQFDDFGFKRTLENQIENYKNRTSMEFVCEIDELENIENIYLITVFRVAQELLINAIKHSQGSRVDINISRNVSDIQIRVSDNGVGMKDGAESLENHFGLKIMKERVEIIGGFVKIETSSEGTRVSVDIPLADKNQG